MKKIYERKVNSIDLLVRLLGCAFCLLLFAACATPSAELPAPPAKYIYEMEKPQTARAANSLWNDETNIFEDRKARMVNDIVLINIVESLSGSGAADTTTKRDSSGDYGVDNMLGTKKSYNFTNTPLVKKLYGKDAEFEFSAKGSSASQFKGEGDTNREGELIATVTAKVVEVLPNGNLVLSARKELTINEEKQILVFSGTARPDDISSNNTILSTKIADAKVYYVGKGVIHDKQKPGWLVRILDNVWPF